MGPLAHSLDAAALAAELEKLRAENRNLKLRDGAGLDTDDDAALFDDFLSKFNAVLDARHAGAADARP